MSSSIQSVQPRVRVFAATRRTARVQHPDVPLCTGQPSIHSLCSARVASGTVHRLTELTTTRSIFLFGRDEDTLGVTNGTYYGNNSESGKEASEKHQRPSSPPSIRVRLAYPFSPSQRSVVPVARCTDTD
ncbi:hypothetical protein C8039_00105 [Halogeometricum sp. wsp3]|nr:hypothetical protein C8039_00105 [Halogeometricum sp. wsp3]